MKDAAAGLSAGLLFGAGLALSELPDVDVILGFLDFAGRWNPQLLFAMAGAVVAHGAVLRLARRRKAPVLAPQGSGPVRKQIDTRLIVGAAIFGLGWGVTGICPGAAIVAAGAGVPQAWLVIPAILLGLWIGRIGNGGWKWQRNVR